MWTNGKTFIYVEAVDNSALLIYNISTCSTHGYKFNWNIYSQYQQHLLLLLL